MDIDKKSIKRFQVFKNLIKDDILKMGLSGASRCIKVHLFSSYKLDLLTAASGNWFFSWVVMLENWSKYSKCSVSTRYKLLWCNLTFLSDKKREEEVCFNYMWSYFLQTVCRRFYKNYKLLSCMSEEINFKKYFCDSFVILRDRMWSEKVDLP